LAASQGAARCGHESKSITASAWVRSIRTRQEGPLGELAGLAGRQPGRRDLEDFLRNERMPCRKPRGHPRGVAMGRGEKGEQDIVESPGPPGRVVDVPRDAGWGRFVREGPCQRRRIRALTRRTRGGGAVGVARAQCVGAAAHGGSAHASGCSIQVNIRPPGWSPRAPAGRSGAVTVSVCTPRAVATCRRGKPRRCRRVEALQHLGFDAIRAADGHRLERRAVPRTNTPATHRGV